MDDLFSFTDSVCIDPSISIDPSLTANSKDTDYDRVLQYLFSQRYKEGMTEVHYTGVDLVDAIKAVDAKGCNPSDIKYNVRSHRRAMPSTIAATAPENREWTIASAGKSLHKFILISQSAFSPDDRLFASEIPNRSITQKMLPFFRRDEQAMLAVIQDNALLDLFLRARLEHYQAHLRMTVPGIGQVEVDDFYTGIDNTGSILVPVQAKTKKGAVISAMQIHQDIAAAKFIDASQLVRPVGIIVVNKKIVCMEFAINGSGEIQLVQETHYILT